MKNLMLFAALLVAQSPGCSPREIPPTAEIGPAPALDPYNTEFPPRLYEPRPGTPLRWETSSAATVDYGVVGQELGHGPKLRASDPRTLKRVQDESEQCPPRGPCPNPKPDRPKAPISPPAGPFRRLDTDTNRAAVAIVAALLVLSGVILVSRKKVASG